MYPLDSGTKSPKYSQTCPHRAPVSPHTLPTASQIVYQSSPGLLQHLVSQARRHFVTLIIHTRLVAILIMLAIHHQENLPTSLDSFNGCIMTSPGLLLARSQHRDRLYHGGSSTVLIGVQTSAQGSPSTWQPGIASRCSRHPGHGSMAACVGIHGSLHCVGGRGHNNALQRQLLERRGQGVWRSVWHKAWHDMHRVAVLHEMPSTA